jgi:PKHD-type hydroxylase
MFKRIDHVLTPAQLQEIHAIADRGTFVDGRLTNPHNTSKQNLMLNDQDSVARTSQMMANALFAHEEFRNFVIPKAIAPPLVTAYRPGMRYGLHADSAFMPWNGRQQRSDVSCTLFLNDPASYEGGELHVVLGDEELFIKLPAGSAILYPSTTMHEVTPVTAGERRVGLTFIQSRIADPARRELMYELGEVAALEGNGMRPENYMRLERVRQNLLREWGDHD